MEVTNEDSSKNLPSSLKQEQSEGSVVQHHISSSTRLMRNLAEKMRRDKLNTHISELASIVPMVATATKRIDKTSVLRLSAAYLRIHQNVLSGKIDGVNWKPYFLNEDNLSSLLLEAVNGFLLIITTTGKIVYVSEDIEKILGHSPVDVVGHSIYTILHPDDHLMLQQQLQCDTVVSVQENLLIGIVRLLRDRAITELSLMDGCHDEYITHHTLDGRIICTDHRISIIAGFLPEEVTAKSAYEYIFSEDIALSLFAHRQIFSNSNGTSKAMYRLHTKTDKLIYLKSQGILQYNSVTGEVDSFICINKLLSDKQGKLELQRFRTRYYPSIKEIVHEKDVKKEEDSSQLASTSSNNVETPSKLAHLWNQITVPFPLSFLPSEMLHAEKMIKSCSVDQGDDDVAKKFKQEPDSTDQIYKKDSLFSKHDPHQLWQSETDLQLKYYHLQSATKTCAKKTSPKEVTNFCHDKVTSTTSDASSVQSNIPVDSNWSSPEDDRKSRTNTKTFNCAKKVSKKRTKQTYTSSVNQFASDKFYRANYSLNSGTERNVYGTELDSQIPSKKHCNHTDVNTSESVDSTTKLERRHPSYYRRQMILFRCRIFLDLITDT